MRYVRPCACGASSNSFKINIGPFFVASCCEEKGYDSLGNPPKEPIKKEEPKETLTKEAVNSVVKTIDAINKAIKKPKKSKKKKVDDKSEGS